jgi:hypothetical protein
MTDILTNDEARQALGRGVSDASKSGLLDIAIGAVTAVLEDYAGPVVYGTVTGEVHDGGGNKLYLDRRPVVSVVQVVTYDNTTAATLTLESNTSKPTAGFFLDATAGAIVSRNQNADDLFPVGRSNVVVSYVAGRFATQGSITDKWKQAAVMTLKSNWRAFENASAQLGEFDVPQASFPSFMVPNIAKQILGKEWQAGSGIGE